MGSRCEELIEGVFLYERRAHSLANQVGNMFLETADKFFHENMVKYTLGLIGEASYFQGLANRMELEYLKTCQFDDVFKQLGKDLQHEDIHLEFQRDLFGFANAKNHFYAQRLQYLSEAGAALEDGDVSTFGKRMAQGTVMLSLFTFFSSLQLAAQRDFNAHLKTDSQDYLSLRDTEAAQVDEQKREIKMLEKEKKELALKAKAIDSRIAATKAETKQIEEWNKEAEGVIDAISQLEAEIKGLEDEYDRLDSSDETKAVEGKMKEISVLIDGKKAKLEELGRKAKMLRLKAP